MQFSTHLRLFRACLLGLAMVFGLSSVGTNVLAQPRMPAAATLPAPSGVQVRQDDRVATVQWNVPQDKSPFKRPTGVSGYRVTWGPADQPKANTRLVEQNIVQLQPLTNGQPYVVSVQSVDSYGNLSAASPSIQFTGDSNRVDSLRSRMNGFFDDFNLAQGAPDELKWNTAYSRCNSAEMNAYFINGQSHVHNLISSSTCDRGQQVNRARVPLDLSDNGTRTITFDFDGVHRRNHWYLDLAPNVADIGGPAKYEPGTLRLKQVDQAVEFIMFDATGTESIIAITDNKTFPTLDWAGVGLVPNVRRVWEWKVRKDSAELRIDGTLVLATKPGAFQLTRDQYDVRWGTFSYNTVKANQPYVLAHWDNFGFDAPAGKTTTTVTHNYKLTNAGTDYVEANRGSGTVPTVKLNIPDSIDGSVARRLMFTLQMADFSSYAWSPNDRVLVNGVSIAIPQPKSPISTLLSDFISNISPFSVVLQVPDGVLKQGENTISFEAQETGILNIHAEFDFPANGTAAYTPPVQAAAGSVLPAMPPVGANLAITNVGQQKVDVYAESIWEAKNFNPTVSGIIPVGVEASNATALEATGTNSGIIFMELMVDRRAVMSIRTDSQSPSPSVSHTFSLDTRQLTNGTHEIYVRTFDPKCTPSITEYHMSGAESGGYVPLHFNVQNPGGRAVDVPVSAGKYTVNIPIANITTIAACSSLTKLSSAGTSTANSQNSTTGSPEGVLRREDEQAVPSVRDQFFICD